MTTNSSPPSRAASAPSGSAPYEHLRDLVQERVAELVPRAVVDVLEVVAVDDEQAQRLAPLLRERQLAIEPLFQPAAVEDPGERVRDRAVALVLQGERDVERRPDVSGENGRRVELHGIRALARADRRNHRPELVAARPQREPDERAAGRRLPQSSSWQTTFGSTSARMAPSSDSESGDRDASSDLQAASSTAAPASSQTTTWLMSTGRTRESDAAASADDLVGVAQPAEVDEQPREGREVERSALAQLLGERRESLGERPEELRRVLGQRPVGLDVERADDERARAQRDRELGARRWAARRGSRDRPARPAPAGRVRDGPPAP